MGAVAKSYMMKDISKYLVIYEEALVIYDYATTPF
jgi:hypothetical protein